MKKKWTRRLVIGLLALVFLFSGGMLLKQAHDRQVAQRANEEAARIAAAQAEEESSESPTIQEPESEPETEPATEPEPEPEPIPEEAEFLLTVDLASLQETNEDVIGWFFIPDTVMSYPLLRSHDNDEYLTLTWDGQYSRSGSIFLERRSSPDLSDFHTLIYGHNWEDGLMFSDLENYEDQEYLDSHPYVYIATGETVLQYQVFSAYVADVVSDTYRLVFEDDARKQSSIDYYLEQSVVAGGIVPTTEDRIVTLSTCTGQGIDGIRWVVHGILIGEFTR